jgi:phosphoglycolate phosphatase-like HAD superfamily hydrolase
MANYNEAAHPLLAMVPQGRFFVGLDSDGCAFDTMEIKHKECFCPNTIKWWQLQAVSKFAREAVEFVNLYSPWRGINRWPALVMVFDLLRERPEVQARHATIPEAIRLREFMESGLALSNDGLRQFMAAVGPDPELEIAWRWSTGVNATVADIVHGVPPFPYVRESLEQMAGESDVVVVSATPGEALVREWDEHDIARYAAVIAGQEMGTKQQHLALAAGNGRYAPDHVLMIGDAPGDMAAARANGFLFFPINPGREDASWERFYRESYARFTGGAYAGAYEAELIRDFLALLPEVPWWKK